MIRHSTCQSLQAHAFVQLEPSPQHEGFHREYLQAYGATVSTPVYETGSVGAIPTM